MTQEHGFLVIDKDPGITSHDVVARVRKRMGTKRVGHAGTLDPMATGVLVVGINNATKFLQYIVTGKKRYLATIRLGISTVTDDKEGEVTATHECSLIKDEDISSNLRNFVGHILQVPSSVSAIKLDGERAYDLVREGKEVQLEPRPITIHELKVLSIDRSENLDVKIDVTCSSGTYIRAIARDLGNALGVGGHLTELRRIEVEPFTIIDSAAWQDAELFSLADYVGRAMATRNLTFEEVAELRFGRRISASSTNEAVAGIDPTGSVVALLKNQDGQAQPQLVLNP